MALLHADSGRPKLVAGGHAPDAETFLTALRDRVVQIDPAHLACAPLGQWIGSSAIDAFPADLPLRLEPGAPALVMEEIRDGQGQISFCRWGADARGLAVAVTDLGCHPPLDSQFGAFPALNCPADLGPHLFPAQRDSIFAVLDSAAYPGILMRIESEGLRSESLFQGDGGESLAEVSPYLVELPADARLLRHLFTRDERDSARGLYSADAALFLHAPDGFEALRRHLRKFTKLPDGRGNWLFLRFWSTQFRDYLAHHPDPALPARFFDGIERAFCRMPNDRWLALSAGTAPPPSDGFLDTFTAHSRVLLRQRFTVRLREVLGDIYRDPPSATQVAAFYCHARSRGYRAERAIARYVETLFILFRHRIDEAHLLDRPEARAVETYSDTGRARALLDVARQLETAP
ncbi:DUF4123 domain-containing protein [Paracoccus sp. S1E-3]|uniref:DUF4123 domain-containing protein n=1 Tax=Paracoccus sp. S1E-3 TaxID=2756130 RepID=UPI0015EF25E9|nr:DUF4123 domain-containing protein [Paracoccus sp. S1E-3]MBA4491336.1 DUF4123 domain-containing protein [Paracoccus sp. S1E-3]